MNQGKLDETLSKMSREEYLSALFHNFVVQQTNMAFIFLGRIPNPQTGEIMHDLEGAKFFIDQLEMVEFKTRGNLDKPEEALLKQSLTALRMAFVEAVKSADRGTATPASTEKPPETPENTFSDEDERKKFSKKY
jgi:hypothetical protein